MGMGKGSTNQLELNRSVIQEMTIWIPSAVIQEQFEAIAQPMHDKIRVLNDEIKNLISIRDRLLPKLMSGELEV